MKIKSFNLVFLSLFCLTIFFSMDTIAQTFMKYQTWATEKNKDPGLNPYNPALTRLPFFYNQVFNSVSGNFNNDYDNNTPFYENIPINEIQLLVNKENILKVYSVETQPYRVLDPSMQTEGVNVNYTFASVVNNQEVLTPPRALEEKSNNPLIPIPRYDAYTTHATIERYNDIENQSYFGNLTTNPISFVVSGNFIGDMKDEIAVFQLYNGSQRLVMLKNNETSETMNYNLTVNQTETYTYTGQPALNQIKAITVGRFYNNLGLYQDIIVFSKNSGQNQIWRFKFDNGAWNLTLLNSNANMDFDNLAGVASGDFDGDVDDVACLYNSSSNSQQINIYYNNNFAANPPNVYNRSNTILDFSKIEHLVAGNYNDSLVYDFKIFWTKTTFFNWTVFQIS